MDSKYYGRDYKTIPQESSFNKKVISDLVYGYMQINSYVGETIEGDRVSFVYKSPTLVGDIAEATKIAPRTVRNKINKLITSEYIKEDSIIDLYSNKVDIYAFKKVEFYQNINIDTLRFLVNTGNEDVIKVYCYLLNRCVNVNRHYNFSKKELILKCFGVKNEKSGNNYKKIEDILNTLINNGLLELEDKKMIKEVGRDLYTSYFIVKKINIKYIDNFSNKQDKNISEMEF